MQPVPNYDYYSEWDKFNVDEELARLDAEEKKSAQKVNTVEHPRVFQSILTVPQRTPETPKDLEPMVQYRLQHPSTLGTLPDPCICTVLVQYLEYVL